MWHSSEFMIYLSSHGSRHCTPDCKASGQRASLRTRGERAGEASSSNPLQRPRVDHRNHQQSWLGLHLHLLLLGSFPSMYQRKAWSIAMGAWNTLKKIKPSGHTTMVILEQLQWILVWFPKHHLIVKTQKVVGEILWPVWIMVELHQRQMQMSLTKFRVGFSRIFAAGKWMEVWRQDCVSWFHQNQELLRCCES